MARNTQKVIEARMAEAGRQRTLTNISKALAREAAAETPAGAQMLRRAIAPLSKAIAEFCADALKGTGGRLHTAAVPLAGVDPDLAAFITVRYTVSLAAKPEGASLHSIARGIGKALDAELRAARFEQREPALYKAIVTNAKDRGAAELRIMASVLKAEKEFEFDLDGWTRQQHVQVGTKLVELATTALDIFKVRYVRAGRRSSSHIVTLAPGMEKWFADYNGAAAATKPYHFPCVSPPNDWQGTIGGGFHHLRPQHIITRPKALQRAALEAADLSQVFAAVNALQRTRWAINPRILKVLQQCHAEGTPLDCLPPVDDSTLPVAPDNWDQLTKRERGDWKRTRRDVRVANLVARSKRLQFARQLKLAEEYADEQAIYFVYRLDFRGRAYPQCELISPQGDDLSKSFIHFADAVPLGPHGRKWLAIQGANLFGYDKVSMAEREAWADRFTLTACSIAYDPLTDLAWTEADKPWQFLAWCYEWADLSMHVGRGFEPHTFISRLPVALDGSCNGIQHFSAMLRDPIAGAAVNLVPGPLPNDIYQRVADAVTTQLRAWSDPGTQWIVDIWLAMGIDRKITKRPVMVLPYGGTFRSCLSYVTEAVNEKLGRDNPFGDEASRARVLLAGQVWAAMGEVIVSSRQAMGWVQQVARALAAENKPMIWTAPSGWMAVQVYWNTRRRTVTTRFHGKAMQFTDHEETPVIDASRQALAGAPNFVHSLDAAALMRTINNSLTRGINAFAMIHDSYGTHAGNTEELATTLRDAFVDMYKNHDPLADLYHTAIAELSPERAAELPAPPPRGDLDIDLVRQSTYFFA